MRSNISPVPSATSFVDGGPDGDGAALGETGGVAATDADARGVLGLGADALVAPGEVVDGIAVADVPGLGALCAVAVGPSEDAGLSTALTMHAPATRGRR
jgi:hypothetical protein